MAVSRARYQTAHITIVVAYTLFCVAVLGIEDPIPRFIAGLASALPILWAVFTLALARVPPETMAERLREAASLSTLDERYKRVGDELIGLTQHARELISVDADRRGGRLSAAAAFDRRAEIEQRMKRQIERIGEAACG